MASFLFEDAKTTSPQLSQPDRGFALAIPQVSYIHSIA
jgi:hypothetical protein